MGNLDGSGGNTDNDAGPLPAATIQNSPYDSMQHGGGINTYKEITIAGTGAQINANLFLITGAVEMLALWGVFTDATETVTMTGCYFDTWDAATSHSITLGIDCSDAWLGSVIFRNADKGVAGAFLENNQPRVADLVGEDAYRPFCGALIIGTEAIDTHIRFRVTTDGSTDAKIKFGLSWVPRSDDALIVAV